MSQPPELSVAPPVAQAAADVIAIHCSEGRFTRPFDELLARVGSPDADHITVPGGPWWLAEAGRLTKSRLARMAAAKATPARELLERYLREGSLRRVILLGHQECSWYARLHRSATPADLVRRQGEDLLRARDVVVETGRARLSVAGYFLTFDDAGARFRALF